MEAELKETETWNKVRTDLGKSYELNAQWKKAIKLFQTRLERKYFNPLQDIIDKKSLKGEGFSILTVQCSVIEALAAFRKGYVFNYRRTFASPTYEYSGSKDLYVNFLRTASIFKNNFFSIGENGDIVADTPFNAEQFYSDVRCGLLHEARTKGRWIINATKKKATNEKIFFGKRWQ